MTGAQLALDLDVGLPLRLELQLMADAATPCDLTGASFEAFIRPCAGKEPLVTLTVQVAAAATGLVVISATAEALAVITQGAAWNLLMTDTLGHKSVAIRGTVELAGVIQ